MSPLLATGFLLLSIASSTATAGTPEKAAPSAGTVKATASGKHATDGHTLSDPGVAMECLPSAVNCPVIDPSGRSVVTTDSLPIGSTGEFDGTISESKYPTSVGYGSMGSGLTGSPTGPAPGPVNGMGR
ncbi:hypothetical protein [Noviherbaspirillum sp.]|mgnify:CR=1 FL=1|uniref:hypothetical protein n=1 Tax=Noviherbaspirillum sp. TaxID=1926288 RepID=UPI002FE28601